MTEKQLHKAICKYIKLQYPNVYFLSDPSGLKMSIGMAMELKRTRSQHAQLDIVILEPNNTFNGLILEVKKDRSEVFKKNGGYRESKHVQKQRKSIEHLREKGYYVIYVFDLYDAKLFIEAYVNNNKLLEL